MSPAILATIRHLVELAPLAVDLYQRYTSALDKLDAIVAEGRDPTDAEWAALTAITEDLHEQVQAL